MRAISRVAAASLLAAGVVHAENASYCTWDRPRGGVVRNSLFIEGGNLMKGNWLDDSFPNCNIPPGSPGNLYRLDFNKSFDVSKDDPNTILVALQETLDGTAPTYVGGTMFADDNEWYTFGGLAYPGFSNSSSSSPVTWNGLYRPTSLATNAPMGIRTNYPVTGNITEYITNGAGVSVPSESKGFYFSGYRSANSSGLSYWSNDTDKPTTLVDTMLQLDSSSYNNPVWSQTQLPSNIAPRADAAMVWVPVGSHGALVVIGGVTIPAGLSATGTLTDSEASNVTSVNPDFISQIPVYDIGSKTWYLQQASGAFPPVTAQACAVRASPSDGSSHQIFMYGGYDGTYEQPPYDTTWVLSLPAFRWIQVDPGDSRHGRSSHVCATPYPNKMIIVGGVQQYGYGAALKTRNFFDVFDLNTLTWTGKYDAGNDTAYTVPSVVADAIGGSNAWGTPMDAGLTSLFKQPYQGKITNFYPYAPESTPTPTPIAKSTSKHSWLIPVVVVVVVLVVATTVAGAWFFCWRRRRQHQADDAVSWTTQRGRIARWMAGTTSDPLPPKSLVSDETTEIGEALSPTVVAGPHEAFGNSYFLPKPAEMEGVATPSSRGLSPPVSGMTSPGSIQASQNQKHISHELESRPQMAIRDHPMYPPSIAGRRGQPGNKTVSSPSEMGSADTPLVSSSHSAAGQMSPYELPENRSNEGILPVVKDNLDLTHTESRTTSQTFSGTPTDHNSAPSPDLQPVKALSNPQVDNRAPSGTDSGAATHQAAAEPRTPDQPGHVRNNSSLSTTVAQLSPMSTGEEQRRSVILSNLPEKPAAVRPHQPQQQSSLPPAMVAESAVSGVSALTQPETQGSTLSPSEVSPITRRPGTTTGDTSMRHSRQTQSAYAEQQPRLESDDIPLPDVQLGKDGWGGGTL